MSTESKKSGSTRTAVLCGVVAALGLVASGYALDFVRYSDNDAWSDTGLTVPALTVSGAVTGGTLGLAEGAFSVVNTTQLVFIASGVTNVIDADITSG